MNHAIFGRHKYYKNCFVPLCTNTSFTTPEKLFISVPKEKTRRRAWILACRRDLRGKPISTTSTLYCCQDHFDLAEDMDNFLKFRLTGGRLQSKKNTVPRFFDCQNRRRKYTYEVLPEQPLTRDVEVQGRVTYWSKATLVTALQIGTTSTANAPVTRTTDVQMADQMVLNIKQEVEEDDDWPAHNDPALYDVLKQEIKEEPDTSLEFYCVKSEPEEETDLPQQIEAVAASVSNTESSAGSSYFPGWKEPTEREKTCSLESLCRPCYVVLERIDCIPEDSLALDCDPKTEVKSDLESDIETEDDFHFVSCSTKSEEVDISDVEFPADSADSEDGNLPTQPAEKASTSKTFATASTSTNFLNKKSLNHRVTTGRIKILGPPSTGVKENSFEGETCQQQTPKSTLESHVFKHPSLKTFKCQFCGSEFSDKNNLQKHKLTHVREEPVGNEVSPKSNAKISCDICSKQFTQRATLRVHMRRHMGLKPYACHLCNYKFTVKSDLNRHLFKHKNEKPFSCEICSKCFTERGSLNVHMGLHTELPQHQCNVCLHRFRQKSQLSVHMRQHEGVKPFKCQVCDQNFATKCTMQRHELTHTDERPLKCEGCSKRFKDKNSLSAHAVVHTGVRPHECEDCDKKFARKSQLIRHMLSHRHKGTSERKSALLGTPVYIKSVIGSKVVYVKQEGPC